MVSWRSPILWMVVGFVAVSACLLPFTLQGETVVKDGVLQGDAAQYDVLGTALATGQGYTLDGITPFTEREPGYPLLLALAYLFAGIGSYAWVMIVQATLHVAATLYLVASWRDVLSERARLVAIAFLLFLPSVLHVIFSLTRESFALSLMMVWCGSVLRIRTSDHPVRYSVLAGIAWGWATLTYAPFLLLPVLVVPALVSLRLSWKYIALTLLIAAAVVAPWGVRNAMQTGKLCLTGCYRQVLQWHVRGEQAEHLRGITMPARCLYAEYISRDWSDVSPYCNFNAVWHRQWPDGFVGVPADQVLTRIGQQKILAHIVPYLWLSVFEVVELHLPYVNGWGRVYNILAVLGTALLYLGLLGAIGERRREYLLLLACMVYITGVFALTDATPRYRMPVVFAYALLAGAGYDRITARLWRHT